MRKHQKAQTICNWSAVLLSAGHVSCWSTATCSARLCRLCDLCVRRLYNCVRVCAIRSVLMCLPGHTQPHTCTGMLGTSSGCISSRGSQLYCNAACKSAEGWRSTLINMTYQSSNVMKWRVDTAWSHTLDHTVTCSSQVDLSHTDDASSHELFHLGTNCWVTQVLCSRAWSLLALLQNLQAPPV